MKKKQLPKTSLQANKMATAEMRDDHHKKILSAIEKLGSANYEAIASECGLDRHQVGRRLSELERMQLVYKPGIQAATKSGRSAYVYALTSTPKTPIQIVDDMMGKATKTALNQTSLF